MIEENILIEVLSRGDIKSLGVSKLLPKKKTYFGFTNSPVSKPSELRTSEAKPSLKMIFLLFFKIES